MDVSLIIINYNTKQLIKDCLNSIYKHTYDVQYEIIVVDNASVDGSVDMIKTDFPDVILIESDTNLGFGKANNLGIKVANGDFIFFLNSDTVLLNNAVEKFYRFYCQYSSKLKIGTLGCILLNRKLLPVHSSQKFPQKMEMLSLAFKSLFVPTIYQTISKKERLNCGNDPYFQVDYVTGADLFMPKYIVDKLNGFDTCYFMYYEDSDIQKRLNSFGYNSYIINEPKIIHLQGSSSVKNLNHNKRIIITESMFIYFKKHSNKISYMIFRILFFILKLPTQIFSPYNFKERINYISLLLKL